MTDTDTDTTEKPKAEAAPLEKPVCGIIMPIAGDGEYSADHWRRVQRIIIRSIEKADMTVRLVWESPEVDVIHARILQGIYESDVVICDVSGLNPNVMLELGLRLSTKRPTIVVTDSEKKPPFDIGVFQYHSYQRDLEYNAVDGFIEEIATKIRQVYDASLQGRYKSFVENFTFEVVEPTEVSVPADVAIRERMDVFSRQLSRIEKVISAVPQPSPRRPEGLTLTWETFASEEVVGAMIRDIAMTRRVSNVSHQRVGRKWNLRVSLVPDVSSAELEIVKASIQEVIDGHEDVPF
jgi:hypothetical protein